MTSVKSEAEVRVRVKRSPRPFLRRLLLVLLCAYVVYLVYGFVHKLFVSEVVQVDTIKQGVVQNSIPINGFFVRREITVPSPQSGRLKVIIPEGEKVRVGQLVAQVISPSLDKASGETAFNITAPQSGLISYNIDGLEDYTTTTNVSQIDLNKIKSIDSGAKTNTDGNQVEAGKTAFKIVDSLSPLYIICDLGNNAETILKEGGKYYSLSFANKPEELVSAKVVQANFQGNKQQMLLSIPVFDKKLIGFRRSSFQIVTASFDGCFVPKNAIIQKNGQNGIFTVYKERVKWKKVDIKGTAGDTVVITGVNPGSSVIVNPSYIEEGYPIHSN